MVAPFVDQLADEYAGRAKVGKVNVDEDPNLAQRYGVMSIPTLMVVKKGQWWPNSRAPFQSPHGRHA
jgi:thioredoxin 1